MRSIFVLLSACSTVAQATECQVAEETTMLQTRRSVQKRMTATDTQGLNARGLVKSLEHVANNFASMTTDDVNQALADAAAALATLSPAIQAQVGFLQDTINHASEAVEACHGDPGVVQRAALWEAAEAQAVLSATCEAELATAVADEAQICSAASVADVQSECACNEATARREDKEELCAAILTAYEFAYCEHNLQCNTYHDCHETETAVYNQVRGDVEAEMVPVELEYIAAQQSTCIMNIIQSTMLAGGQLDFAAIAACSAVDASPLSLVYPDLLAAPEACPGATTGSPQCLGAACPDTSFPHHMHSGGPYCYSDQAYASVNSGPCESWCTTDASAGDGCGGCCGDISAKVCVVRASCPHASFPHPMHSGGPYCYSDQAYASVNSGPCESWCTTDAGADDGCGGCCGDISAKLCVPQWK